MRDYEFRGKVREEFNENFFEEKFIYGNLVIYDDGSPFIITDEFQADVNPETVGQFTGVHDFDANRIFEGDILRDRKSNKIYKIKFNELHVAYMLYDQFGGCQLSLVSNPYKNYALTDYIIIGNIYDNPELLKA